MYNWGFLEGVTGWGEWRQVAEEGGVKSQANLTCRVIQSSSFTTLQTHIYSTIHNLHVYIQASEYKDGHIYLCHKELSK